MPRPILITSIGRTATQWLAACLGWDHEPGHFKDCAVSPTHLHKMAVDGWEPPEETRFVIIMRDPETQLLSIINRWEAVHGPAFRDVWLGRLPHYLKTLDRLVEQQGAQLMDYEIMVADHACLLSELASVGLPRNGVSWISEKVNTHPKVITKLPAWAKATAWTIQQHYEKWIDEEWHDHDTRSA